MMTLVAEYFSPWSEKARWALDHHGHAYDYREHVPLLGEPALRLRARRLRGRVSTPLLVADGEVLNDSLAIARRADQAGSRAPLFPAGHEAAILAWNDRSEAALAAARVLYLDRLGRDHEARVEMQPPYLPLAVRRASVPVTDIALRFLRRKYGLEGATTAAAEATLARELDGLRAALDGRPHVHGDAFTYADITMAVTLQLVAPVDDRYIPLGPASRACCTHPSLAARHADLVAWRDGLYEKYRRAA